MPIFNHFIILVCTFASSWNACMCVGVRAHAYSEAWKPHIRADCLVLVSVCIFAPQDHPPSILFYVCLCATLAVVVYACVWQSVCRAPCWCGASSVSWQWVEATAASAISMSFHGVPQWLLGDSVVDMDLSFHRKLMTPRSMARSTSQFRHLNL